MHWVWSYGNAAILALVLHPWPVIFRQVSQPWVSTHQHNRWRSSRIRTAGRGPTCSPYTAVGYNGQRHGKARRTVPPVRWRRFVPRLWSATKQNFDGSYTGCRLDSVLSTKLLRLLTRRNTLVYRSTYTIFFTTTSQQGLCGDQRQQAPLISSFADRSFSIAARTVWNSLPPSTRSADTIGTFKSRLKTDLLTSAYIT